MKMNILAASAALSLCIIAGGFLGFKGGQWLQHRNDEKQTREMAIGYNCGQYNAKTGIFEWVQLETAQALVQSDSTIYRGALPVPMPPLPQRKPEPPKIAAQPQHKG